MGRLAVVICEGAAQPLVGRWTAAGLLPSLAALRRAGTWGAFVAPPVPYEPPALASVFTGVAPGEHGCFSYWHAHAPLAAAAPGIFQSSDLGAPMLWERPEAAGLEVGL